MPFLKIKNCAISVDSINTVEVDNNNTIVKGPGFHLIFNGTELAEVFDEINELRGNLIKMEDITTYRDGLHKLLQYYRDQGIEHSFIEIIKDPQKTINRSESLKNGANVDVSYFDTGEIVN